MEERWRLLRDGPADGAANMARDEALLDSAGRACRPTLRLYAWSPAALSLGAHQPGSDADLAACRKLGIDLVRRPTGGGAVLHASELTYSVSGRLGEAPFPASVIDLYAAIASALVAGLARLGVRAEPSGAGRPDGSVGLDSAGPGPGGLSVGGAGPDGSSGAGPRGSVGPDSAGPGPSGLSGAGPGGAIAAALVSGLARLGVRAEPCGAGPGPDGPDGAGRGSAQPGLAARLPSLKAVEPAPAHCFSRPSRREILVGGRKLIGSAQVRRRRAFLQHGSLLIDMDASVIAQVLPAAREHQLEHQQGPTTLREVLGRELDRREDLERAIVRGFADVFGCVLEPGALSRAEAESAARLRTFKYLDARWTLEGRLRDAWF